MPVQNNKPLYKKYVNYFCDVTVYVPATAVLPTTTITGEGNPTYFKPSFVSGELQTQVISFQQNWGPNNLIISGASPSTHMRVNLQEPNVNNVVVSLPSGLLRIREGSFSGLTINSTQASFFIESKVTVYIRH